MEPICKDVVVQLSGEDGNAFMIIGRVTSAMRRANIDKSIIDSFIKEATSGDYDNVLCTCGKYVDAI